MKCKQGDIARIIFSLRKENIGRVVKVVEYIGKFSEGEEFDFRGMTCKCPIGNHYWWIEATDLTIGLGPSPRAYIADAWLEPIRPEQEKETQKETVDIFA